MMEISIRLPVSNHSPSKWAGPGVFLVMTMFFPVKQWTLLLESHLPVISLIARAGS